MSSTQNRLTSLPVTFLGNHFAPRTASVLYASAIANGFTSSIWIPAALVNRLQIQPKKEFLFSHTAAVAAAMMMAPSPSLPPMQPLTESNHSNEADVSLAAGEDEEGGAEATRIASEEAFLVEGRTEGNELTEKCVVEEPLRIPVVANASAVTKEYPRRTPLCLTGFGCSASTTPWHVTYYNASQLDVTEEKLKEILMEDWNRRQQIQQKEQLLESEGELMNEWITGKRGKLRNSPTTTSSTTTSTTTPPSSDSNSVVFMDANGNRFQSENIKKAMRERYIAFGYTSPYWVTREEADFLFHSPLVHDHHEKCHHHRRRRRRREKQNKNQRIGSFDGADDDDSLLSHAVWVRKPGARVTIALFNASLTCYPQYFNEVTCRPYHPTDVHGHSATPCRAAQLRREAMRFRCARHRVWITTRQMARAKASLRPKVAERIPYGVPIEEEDGTLHFLVCAGMIEPGTRFTHKEPQIHVDAHK